MFFKLHSEGKIGYKKLSKADLGITTGTSHQTHIGLYGDILTFLYNREVEQQAMFVFENNCDFLDCFFDRIESSDGSFRSPKIRKGDKNVVSVVTVIRDYAKKNTNHDWYLLWFGLENEKIVFHLFNNHSKDYRSISEILLLTKNGRIEKTDNTFKPLMNYIENIVNKNNSGIIEELEIASQVGSSKKFRPFDLEKANAIFKDTGRRGEELVNIYLDKLKHQKQIFNFTWYNKSLESGLPYDFTIQENNQNVIHVDAKSTLYKFERPLIFSNQEIDFIAQNSQNYNIFRVYNLSENATNSLRICKNSKSFASTINPEIHKFEKNIEPLDILLKSTKLAVLPTHKEFHFNPEIGLNIT